ncbi:MAG: hypothetical protein RL698_2763, partial [Pseudomonadota bacterium]
ERVPVGEVDAPGAVGRLDRTGDDLTEGERHRGASVLRECWPRTDQGENREEEAGRE